MYFIKLCAVILFGAFVGARKKSAEVPVFVEHLSSDIKNDVQYSVFLDEGENKTLNYVSTASLEVTIFITACGSTVQWTLVNKCPISDQELLVIENTMYGEDKVNLFITKRHYKLYLEGVAGGGYVTIYFSTEPGGPAALKPINNKQLTLRKHRGGKIVAKWEHTLVDPQFTEYCLVMSSRKEYGTLCGAMSDRYGPIKYPPATPDYYYRRAGGPVADLISFEDQDKYISDEPRIICTGRKTSIKIDVVKNEIYHFSVFAINHQSNFTYKLAANTSVVDVRIKHLSIKDGRLKTIDLKKKQGTVIVKYKLMKHHHGKLNIYLVPCNGAVDLVVMQKNDVIESKQMIETYEKITIANPVSNYRYYIKISASKKDENKCNKVMVYVTSRNNVNVPIPEIPVAPSIHEYKFSKRCDSVTIGWLPPKGMSYGYYCFIIRKSAGGNDERSDVNQCELDGKWQKTGDDFIMKICKEIEHNNQKVLIETITRLRQGKTYTVQITVKKRKGITLSYKPLQVKTRSRCSNANIFSLQ